MKNFTYSISTVVHFGKGQISKLGGEIASRASRVLVVYGGGSIKRNGVYDGATSQLKEHGIEWVELGGVEPNPRITTVRKGVELCRQHGLDGVLALRGGSRLGGLFNISDDILLVKAAKGHTFNGIVLHKPTAFFSYIMQYFIIGWTGLQGSEKN